MRLHHLVKTAVVAAALAFNGAAGGQPEPVRNIVLVHGAWVDGSGWKPASDILTERGYYVTVAQEPEASFADDVAAVKRILSLEKAMATDLYCEPAHPNFLRSPLARWAKALEPSRRGMGRPVAKRIRLGTSLT